MQLSKANTTLSALTWYNTLQSLKDQQMLGASCIKAVYIKHVLGEALHRENEATPAQSKHQTI